MDQSSPKLPWGSPALRPGATFPPAANRMSGFQNQSSSTPRGLTCFQNQNTSTPKGPTGLSRFQSSSASMPPGLTSFQNQNASTPPRPHRPQSQKLLAPRGRWGGGSPAPYNTSAGSPQWPHFVGIEPFRTPQPHRSPQNSPRPPWSDNRGTRMNRRSQNQSGRNSPSMNPGGSDDITRYYRPSMIEDPWQNVPPKPVIH